MKKSYLSLNCAVLQFENESGFLAASQEDVINEDTEVIIDKQVGGDEIVFDNWEE